VTGLFGAMWYHGSLPDRLVPLSQGSLEEDFQMLRFSLQSSSLCKKQTLLWPKMSFSKGKIEVSVTGNRTPV
jgi:hypothetical protein